MFGAIIYYAIVCEQWSIYSCYAALHTWPLQYTSNPGGSVVCGFYTDKIKTKSKVQDIFKPRHISAASQAINTMFFIANIK